MRSLKPFCALDTLPLSRIVLLMALVLLVPALTLASPQSDDPPASEAEPEEKSDEKEKSSDEKETADKANETSEDDDSDDEGDVDKDQNPKTKKFTGREGSAEGFGEGVTILGSRPRGRQGVESYPLGVTVIGPRGNPAIDPGVYPEGVTTLGGEDRGASDTARPLVRVQVVETRPVTEEKALPPLDEETVRRAREAREAEADEDEEPDTTIGPSEEEALAAFDQDIEKREGLVPDFAQWFPDNAYPPRKDAYPWNPAEWSKPTFDPMWRPISVWPEGYTWNSWNRVDWAQPTFDPIWVPEDAYGRPRVVPGQVVIIGGSDPIEIEGTVLDPTTPANQQQELEDLTEGVEESPPSESAEGGSESEGGSL